jgi:hypothetical protein
MAELAPTIGFVAAVQQAMVGTRATDKLIREVHPTILPRISTAVATTGNPRDEYVELLKSTALSLGKKAVLNLLIPALPGWMTSGLIGTLLNPLFGYLVGMILELAIRETEIGMFFLYIDLRTSAQGREFEKTARANLEKQKNGTPAEKEKSEKELIDAFRAFVKFTN